MHFIAATGLNGLHDSWRLLFEKAALFALTHDSSLCFRLVPMQAADTAASTAQAAKDRAAETYQAGAQKAGEVAEGARQTAAQVGQEGCCCLAAEGGVSVSIRGVPHYCSAEVGALEPSAIELAASTM